jgi:hypothetical protein
MGKYNGFLKYGYPPNHWVSMLFPLVFHIFSPILDDLGDPETATTLAAEDSEKHLLKADPNRSRVRVSKAFSNC